MKNTETIEETELRTTKEVIEKLRPFPQGVENAKVELTVDYSGDPALEVIFNLAHNFQPDDAWFSSFVDFQSKVRRRIADSGVHRFPYVDIKSAA